MTWNYRVIRQVLPDGLGGTEEYYEIHEVYYNDELKIEMWSTDPVAPGGHSFDDLKADVEYMRRALETPVLDADSLPGKISTVKGKALRE